MARKKEPPKFINHQGVLVPDYVIQSAYDRLLLKLKEYGHDPITCHILIASNRLPDGEDVPLSYRYRSNRDLLNKLLPDLKAVENMGQKEQKVMLRFNLPPLPKEKKKDE